MNNYLIEIHNLTKQFGSGNYALKDLHLHIAAGEIYGIIGMSGAGKSTLLRCLTGLEKPSYGSILFDGQTDTHALRQQLGMVFQHFQLFSSRTAAQNIAYPLEIRGLSQAEQQER